MTKQNKEDNKILETLSYAIDKATQQGKQEETQRILGIIEEMKSKTGEIGQGGDKWINGTVLTSKIKGEKEK